MAESAAKKEAPPEKKEEPKAVTVPDPDEDDLSDLDGMPIIRYSTRNLYSRNS